MKTVKEYFIDIFEGFALSHSYIDSYYLAIIEFERKTDFQSPYQDFHSFIRTYYKTWKQKRQHKSTSHNCTAKASN